MLRGSSFLLVFVLLLAPAPGAVAAAPFLEVDAPRAARSTVDGNLIEVAGHGGNRKGSGHDVVIAIDVSESTLEDSGMELDGDGPRGGTDPELLEWLASRGGERIARKLSSQDFDDTVLAAELAAAGALVARLDPTRFRVALVSFAEDARVLAPLGSAPEELGEALSGLPRDLTLHGSGTNYQAAIETADRLLRPELGTTDDRLRSIVFLSDGAPTRPVHGDRAERYALQAAIDAGRAGIRLFAFAIGPEAEAGLVVLERMAGWTSGRLERVTRPALIVNRLRQLDLVGLTELEVANATTGGEARALRVFPDGSFDGFVELEPGPNRLVFRARDDEGAEHRVERLVTFRPPADLPASVGLPAALPDVSAGPGESRVGADDELVDKLRQRTAEIEAWEALAGERRQRKELELEAVR